MQPLDAHLERFLLDLLPMIRGIARRLNRRYPDHEVGDLESAGSVGVLEQFLSLEGAEPDRSQALNRAYGAMLDEVRRYRWAPRTVGDRARNIEHETHKLSHKHGRAPTQRELAAALGMSITKYAHYRGMAEVRYRCSTDCVEALAQSSQPSPEDQAAHAEKLVQLRDAILALPPRESRATWLTVVEASPASAAAEELGVSASRVSQLRARAMQRLHDRHDQQFAA